MYLNTNFLNLYEELSELLESKADTQRLIDFAGEDLAKRFLVIKNKLRAPENDLYYWVKNKTVDELASKVLELENAKSGSAVKKEIAEKGAELVCENDFWKVYHITTFEAAQKYGRDTKWCITGIDDYGDLYWRKYTAQGFHFYFFITKGAYDPRGNMSKVALAFNPKHLEGGYEIYDQQDHWLDEIPNSDNLLIPEFRICRSCGAILEDDEKLVRKADGSIACSGCVGLETRLIYLFWEGLSGYSSDAWFNSGSKEKEEILWWALDEIGRPVNKDWALDIFWMWANGIEEDAFVDFSSPAKSGIAEEFKLCENMWDSCTNTTESVANKNLIWTCFFDDKEIGTVVAVNEEEALEKMMQKYPEYPYSKYDGCYYVDAAPKKLTEALSAQESQKLTNAASNAIEVGSAAGHQEYFVELYYCLMHRLAKRFNVNTGSSDFWNTFAHDVLTSIEYDSITDIKNIKRDYINAFTQELGRNMTANEQNMFNTIIKAIPRFFEIDSPSEYCRVTVFQSANDFYDLVVSGWYSEDIDFDDCEEAFDAGWNNVNVDYSTEANNRGYHSDWIDAMDSIYKTGKKSREFFDYLDTL